MDPLIRLKVLQAANSALLMKKFIKLFFMNALSSNI